MSRAWKEGDCPHAKPALVEEQIRDYSATVEDGLVVVNPAPDQTEVTATNWWCADCGDEIPEPDAWVWDEGGEKGETS